MLKSVSFFNPYDMSSSRTKTVILNESTCIDEPIVAAFGVFDGVHSGHRMLIEASIEAAHDGNCSAAIITFDRDPDELFAPAHGVRHILTNSDRLKLLGTLGADYLIVVPFTRDFSELPPLEFLNGLKNLNVHPRTLFVGSDFRFGYQAQGTVEVLSEWGTKHGCTVCSRDLLCEEGAPITATRIRNELEQTHIAEANRLLARIHYFRGYVKKGRGKGTELGFATANLTPFPDYVHIGDGVYGGLALVDGVLYRAAISVGVPRTFGDVPYTIEPHILDYDGELYGREIALYFTDFIRPMQMFDTQEMLVETVLNNIEWVRSHIELPQM